MDVNFICVFLLGWERKLRNAVYQYMIKNPKIPHVLASSDHNKEPVTYIRRAQVSIKCNIIIIIVGMHFEMWMNL